MKSPFAFAIFKSNNFTTQQRQLLWWKVSFFHHCCAAELSLLFLLNTFPLSLLFLPRIFCTSVSGDSLKIFIYIFDCWYFPYKYNYIPTLGLTCSFAGLLLPTTPLLSIKLHNQNFIWLFCFLYTRHNTHTLTDSRGGSFVGVVVSLQQNYFTYTHTLTLR